MAKIKIAQKIAQSETHFNNGENEIMQVIRRLKNDSQSEMTTFSSQDLKDMSDMLEFALDDFKLYKNSQEKEVI